MKHIHKLWLAIGLLTTGFALNAAGEITFSTISSFGHNTNSNGSTPNAEPTRGADDNLYGVTPVGGTYGHGTVFRITTNGLLTTIFHFDGTNGSGPSARLLRAADGYFYGVTAFGGTYDYGTVFKVSTNGSFTSLVSFNDDGITGIYPYGGLVQATNGTLYGTTSYGGAGYGTVFKMNTSGTMGTPFFFRGTNGSNPYAALIQAADGNFYGTTSEGGTNGGYGTLFRITSDLALTSLVHFNGINGAYPRSALVQSTNGDHLVYGMTHQGGTNGGYGTIFATAGNSLQTLVSFSYANGAYPWGPLVLGAEDVLYGTTRGGGAYGAGTGFSLTTNGVFSSVSFSFGLGSPYSPNGLILNSDNLLYGTSAGGGTNGYGTVFQSTTNGEVTVLYSFDNSDATDGAYTRTLIQGAGGSLYGLTEEGGKYGRGTIFAMTTNGARALLYSFDDYTGIARLVQGKDGNLYGTTFVGGTNENGSVFRLATNGVFTTFYSFSQETNGHEPSTLLQGIDGSFYGTTVSGEGLGVLNGLGTIFKLTPEGVMTPLHVFPDMGENPEDGENIYIDGREPNSLVQRNDGTLFGTTRFGGTNDAGTVFKMQLSGEFATLHTFGSFYPDPEEESDPDAGQFPNTLVLGTDGNFYGTTEQGGTDNQGTVFKMTPSGELATLYSFSYGGDEFNPNNDGYYPSSLAQGSDGYLYGATQEGGTYNYGTLFRIKPTGAFTTLYSFEGLNDGSSPYCLILGKDHNYYGTTATGGTEMRGSAFRLSVPASPSIVSQPSSRTNQVGTTASFTVQAEGVLPLTYHWMKDSANLSNGGHLSGATSNVLTLTNVAPADAGLYSVVISNHFGFVVSSNAVLTIPPTLPEALDATNLVWATAGDAIWFGQIGLTHDGVDAGQSGVLVNSESSWVETTVTGPISVSFWWKVSSESGYDFLVFSVNGVPQVALSGEVDWTPQAFNFGAGSQTLRWTYAKDFSVSLGQDSGWLDQVSFALAATTPPSFQTVVKSEGALSLTWSSLIGQMYQLQSTTNLDQPGWSNLGDPITATNLTTSASTPIGSDPRRFYRLVLVP